MADLYDTKKDLLIYARLLPEIEVNGVKTNKYEDYSINVLADEYCNALDNKEDDKISIYLSALLLRFWYVINKIYQQVFFYGYDYNDCFNRLYECINVACKYRAWQNPEKHTNAQACINEAIWGRGAAMMAYEAKLQKNARPIACLDETLDDESNATRTDLLADTYEYEKQQSDEKVYDLVQTLIENGKVIEAIIADNMAFKDVYKHNKKLVKEVQEDGTEYNYTQCSTEFWPFQLVKELNALDEQYYKYFSNTYSINQAKLDSAKETLDCANNQKKYRFIDAAKESMKNYLYLLQ